ncbi:Mur ligase family protein [Shouchella sp. 1P01AA]|uniref:Mur ligase family protein n=1 Tax=Shouchella sp. 1P01AA TaxID=3132301 RepID=UPI0039A0F0DF
MKKKLTAFNNKNLSPISSGVEKIESEYELFPLPANKKSMNDDKLFYLLSKDIFATQLNDKVIIGITGAEGKTITAYMIKHILESFGKRCSIIGDDYSFINGDYSSNIKSQVNASYLKKQLSLSKDSYVIIEIKPESIEKGYYKLLELDYCLFTSMKQSVRSDTSLVTAYYSLFDQLRPRGIAIVNTYDQWGRELLKQLKIQGRKLIYTLGEIDSAAKITDVHIKKNLSVSLYDGAIKYHLNFRYLRGQHNVINAALAFLIARSLNIKAEHIVPVLERF